MKEYTIEYLTLGFMITIAFAYYVIVSTAYPQHISQVLGAYTNVQRYSTQYPITMRNGFPVMTLQTGREVQIFYRQFRVDPSDIP